MQTRNTRLVATGVTIVLALSACASPATPGPGSAGPSQSSSGLPKSMVLAITAEPAELGPFQVSGTPTQGSAYQMAHDFLVVHDNEGEPAAHLAEDLPSLEKGTWKVLIDGGMETTWRLRRGVRWHDGTEFTAKDLVLSWKLANDLRVPWSRPAYARRIREITTPDPYTLVMHWKETYPFAHRPEETVLDPVPAHLLDDVYAADVQALLNSPNWTQAFVGLGPYRIVSWVPGSHMELRAVEDHYAGQAKIGSVTVKFIPDPNTLMAGLLSGAVDVNLSPGALTNQHWDTIQAQWRDGDVIFSKTGTFKNAGPNHQVPPFGDVRVRHALTHAIDREALADAGYIPRTQIVDAMVVPGSEKARRLQDRIHVYPYDPTRAQANLEEAGWARGGDGVVRNAAVEPLEFELRGTGASGQTEGTMIAAMWKNVGVTANLFILPPTLAEDPESAATVKGWKLDGFGLGFGMWERRMHSSAVPVPQNRWAGTNYRYYSHPEVDDMIARMNATLDEAERERIEGALIERVTREAWFVPLYVVSGAAVVRKGITGVKPMSGSPIIVSWYYFTWNILEWDRN